MASTTDPSSHRDLSRDQIVEMLGALGRKLEAQGLSTNIQVVGGAAIALTLRDSRVTQDVDAIVSDHPEEFQLAALEVARDFNIQQDWISDDISDFVASHPEGDQVTVALPGINLYVASPEHLLAMKVRASTIRATARDNEDLVFLAEHLGLETPEEIADLTSRQFRNVFRDNIGHDEYVATVKDAFLIQDLQTGKDPMLRWREDAQSMVKAAAAPTPATSARAMSPTMQRRRAAREAAKAAGAQTPPTRRAAPRFDPARDQDVTDRGPEL